MKSVKKLEIVTVSVELPRILERFEKRGVEGYTIIREVTGKGKRGLQDGDELTDVFKNSYLMIACPEEQVNEIIEIVRPIIKKYGGICLVSDAQWILH
ncbi:MAG: transcriptional regulator [Ignavibacteriaceae bacterium]|jgi:nitrogen regulatory protein PII|nr:transcriptional regulator [Ignavibacteriaceae bacterium]